MKWYVDEGLAVLIAQWKKEFPNAVVYTVGDASHASRDSEHNPEPAGSLPGADLGEVDAADFMVGSGKPGQPTKADVQRLRDDLIEHRDARLWYVIWNHKITSSTTQPWVERDYSGSDQHTDHAHVSVNDKFDKNTASWKLEDEMKTHARVDLDGHSISELKYGDDDDAFDGFNGVIRAQALLRVLQDKTIDPDGVYGPKTRNAVKALMIRVGDKANTGNKIGLAEQKALCGIWKA